MSIRIYLNFNGNCRQAVEFYEKAFRTDKPKIITYGDAPGGAEGIPDTVRNLVLHAELRIAGETVMLSDVPPDRPVTVGNNVSVMTELETPDQVRAVFGALKEGGAALMEPQETFFSGCYAALTDKFGVSWQLNVDSLKD
jgi:PhnB protein